MLAGPGSSTDNAAVRFNGTGGDTFQDSGVLIDDDDNLTVPGTVDGRNVSTDGTKLDGIESGAEVNDVDTVFGRTGAVAAADGDYVIGQITGAVKVFETTVGQAALAGAGTVILLNAAAGEQWKVREIYLSGAGTAFSGGGGDRLLSISDGTAIWSVIPAATLQSLAAARWGDTGVPFPATAADFTLASALGTDITAAYSGGATDYSAGSCTIIIVAERTA